MIAPTTIPPPFEAGFLPLHKRAFGMATGLLAALLVVVATAVYLLRAPEPGFDLALLAQYFYGYEVSWRGALIGGLWAGFSGFVAGWFIAFSRNFALGLVLTMLRIRGDLEQSNDLLDHI